MKNLIFWIIVAFIGFTYFGIRVPINETTRTCIVTGASSGIGAELARQMVKKGWTVLGVARREEKLKALREELGSSFVSFVCDVSDQKQIEETSEKMKREKHEPTLFFLNAGTGFKEKPGTCDFKTHHNTFHVNYFGVIGWVDQWLDALKKKGGGTFVATSSVAAFLPTKGSASYSASKAAVNNAFRAYRVEHFEDNIGFALVMPGPVETDLLKVDKALPFTQQAKGTAAYIIEKTFDGKQEIEPAWFYSIALRVLNMLPERLMLKIIG
jgi:short-subunit dehydrogenase